MVNSESKVLPFIRDNLDSILALAGAIFSLILIAYLQIHFRQPIAESCAMEKPVVASSVGSLPEVVSGKYVLVEPRNPEAIAEGIEMVYKGEVKDRGKKIFSWDECVQKYLQLYSELLEE